MTKTALKGLVLSNVTMQPIASFFSRLRVEFSDFNDVLLALQNQSSRAHRDEFDLVLCYIDTDALFGDFLYGLAPAGAQAEYIAALNTFCADQPRKMVVATTLSPGPFRYSNYADPVLGGLSLSDAATRANEQLVALVARHSNLVLLDVDSLYRAYGWETLRSEPLWYAGRIPYTNRMYRVLAERTEQLLDAYLNRAKKVLVLDLDDTLWGGILGEEGWENIALSEESVGKCYRDFQKLVKSQKRLGILLAINSKNNRADVEAAFARNPMMVLALDDFAAVRINWQDKTENLRELSLELDLGLDTFVAIDDSAVERERMRQTLPEVTIPDFPPRPELLRSWFLKEVVYRHFPKYKLTREDSAKTEQYRAQTARRDLRAVVDFDAFLRNLEIDLKYHVDSAATIERASQLSQKTNQFNVTTKRYSPADITHFVESPDHHVVLLEYADRFGQEGLVGLAILDLKASELDTFLLSCRVIGRGVETQFLSKVEELLAARGCSHMCAWFIPTPRNDVAADMFERHGFEFLIAREDGSRVYRKNL